jgi:two-component system response regulator YesN
MKLLIIEDEKEIRNGIKKVIDWAAHNIIICGDAENGKEGIKLIDNLKPDIILLDIRMPIMNGLEVLKFLRDTNSTVESIVLSGYDDFAYVQQALQLGVCDYLLKPCEPNEILSTVLRVKKTIEKKRIKQKIINKYSSHLKLNIVLIKEKFLLRLINNKVEFNNNLYSIFKNYEINLSMNNIIVTILTFDDYPNENHDIYNNDIELLKFAIKNISTEVIKNKFNTEYIELEEQIIIINNVHKSQHKEFIQTLTSIKQQIKKYLGFTITICVGRRYDTIQSIYLSYQDAQQSLTQKFWLGSDSIVEYNYKEEILSTNLEYPLSKEKDILLLITSVIPNDKDIKIKIDSFFDNLISNSSTTDFVLHCGLILGLSIYKVYIEKKINKSSFDDNIFICIDKIRKCNTLESLKNILFDLIKNIIQDLNITQYSNKNVNIAISFICENYHKDISLDTVANYVNITPSYLSSLFKKHCGINFIEYLHKLRIQKACEIIEKDIWIKGYELASRVGYNEERYFYRIFKKITGLTPTQFKETIYK